MVVGSVASVSLLDLSAEYFFIRIGRVTATGEELALRPFPLIEIAGTLGLVEVVAVEESEPAGEASRSGPSSAI